MTSNFARFCHNEKMMKESDCVHKLDLGPAVWRRLIYRIFFSVFAICLIYARCLERSDAYTFSHKTTWMATQATIS